MKKIFIVALLIAFALGLIVGIFNILDLNGSSVLPFAFSFKKIFFILLGLIVLFFISLIGIPIYFSILIFDTMLSGFITINFIINYKAKGILFILIYLIVFKVFKMFLVVLNAFYSLKISKNIYNFLFHRRFNKRKNILIYVKKLFIISTILFVNEVFLIIIGRALIPFLSNHLLL